MRKLVGKKARGNDQQTTTFGKPESNSNMIEKKGKLWEFEKLILKTDLKNEETDKKLLGNLSKI